MKTGFIGLGAMGLHMASNISRAGMLTSIHNRTHEKAEKLAKQLGVAVFSSAQELANQVDVVFICVSADEDVLQVINAISESIKPNSIVIDCSTVSCETAKQAASILLERQVGFLDAPVSGGVEGAKNATLAMMVGGAEDNLEKVRPILETMSSRIIHMGDIGTGQSTKAVNQIMAAGINQAVTEALAFGQSQNLSMEKVIKVVSSGAAGNWFLQHRGLTMTQSIFEPGFKIALHHKDLKICQKMADQSGQQSFLVDKTLSDYEDLMAKGYGEEDISALFRIKKQTV